MGVQQSSFGCKKPARPGLAQVGVSSWKQVRDRRLLASQSLLCSYVPSASNWRYSACLGTANEENLTAGVSCPTAFALHCAVLPAQKAARRAPGWLRWRDECLISPIAIDIIITPLLFVFVSAGCGQGNKAPSFMAAAETGHGRANADGMALVPARLLVWISWQERFKRKTILILNAEL